MSDLALSIRNISMFRLALIAAALLAMVAPGEARILRVCADPNNLPFSNEKLEGFENRIAALLAKDIGADLQYTWWPQRRGFIRNTLKAGECDLIAGVPSSLDMVTTTRPYYRSTYVFVTAAARGLDITTLDDPRLHDLRIGVQLIGDDGTNSPPAHALSRRGIVENVRGFLVYGDYAQKDPTAAIVEAVAQHDLDVALVWGPQAGYFAKQQPVPLTITPVTPQIDGPVLPMVFDISMGLRREDTDLIREVNAALVRNRAAIDAILAEYGVPPAEPPLRRQ